MNFHALRPDIPGEGGDNTELDSSVHPPRVVHLHLKIDNWAGDDVIKIFPAHLATERLGKALVDLGLRAFELRDADITITPEAGIVARQFGIFRFPRFRWLDVTGAAGIDDIGVTARARLVVSDRALDAL